MYQYSNIKNLVNSLRLKVLFGFFLLISSNLAFSASCWQATSIPQTVGQMSIIPADCTTIPDGFGWGRVDYSYSGNTPADLYIRIPLSNPLVTGWEFNRLLVFDDYDSNGDPVVFSDLVICPSCINITILDHFPPEQGIPQHNSEVRLRHGLTGNCIYGVAQHGGVVNNENCQNATSEMTYIVKYAGGNSYRLEQKVNQQCIYTNNTAGSTAHNWGCWNDLNMRFRFDAASDGYRLRHVNSQQCLYGSPTDGDPIRAWSCWDDPNMVYFIDIID